MRLCSLIKKNIRYVYNFLTNVDFHFLFLSYVTFLMNIIATAIVVVLIAIMFILTVG